MYIFGYGSLIDADGINGRGMSRHYTKADLTEVTLDGYARNWHAYIYYKDTSHVMSSYLGICKGKGSINGVVFPIEERDLEAFLTSEGFYMNQPPYTLENVKIKGFEDVWSCVLSKPAVDLKINSVPLRYLLRVRHYLENRGKKFAKQFHATTKHTKQTKEFFLDR
jgi:hypothetical protein